FEAVKAVIPYGEQYKAAKTDEGWRMQSQMVRYTRSMNRLAAPVAEVRAGGRKPGAKQQAVLRFLQAGEKPQEEILEACGVTKAVLDTLAKNGLVTKEQQDRQVALVGALSPQAGQLPVPVLSPAQQQVAGQLIGCMGQPKPKPALLYGVTASGTTPVLLALIHQVLEAGKTAHVLVPEIGLTPQMLGQMRASFGSGVAVQHSALSNTERLLQWRQIQRGEAQVVVGTRSGVFAPLENLGVLIVDEEQERTYQSESAPRYDALEVARRRAAYHGALLVMASATPSVADYYAAQAGRYHLFSLRQRYGNLPLPQVELVDMRAETGGNIFSGRLVQEMQQNLAENKQTILLLNRRGYRTVGVCRECGTVLKCTECSVPLVYHKAGNRLLCHYCGYSISPVPQQCPDCGGEIRYTGFGTQKAEEELAAHFPAARVLRMDLDSTSQKGAHASMLGQLTNHDNHILLGTQMVEKGLDNEKISHMGVIVIDSLLFSQGYRAYETVFSLVTQVVGRSGRTGAPGRAVIQTVDPQNPVLNLAASQDYPAFYRQEIGFRKLALYPPFCNLCVVGFVAGTEAEALGAARRFSALLSSFAGRQPGLPLRVLGPAPMNVVQVAGSFRYRLTLKCRADAAFRGLIKQVLAVYNQEGWPRKAGIYLDFHTDGG
ncbi:MAG: primosomal protein N', partial [Oscillospiraceae bacterium]